MEGAHGHGAGGFAVHEPGHAVCHFIGRLVGEGEGQDAAWIHAFFNHVGDAAGDGAGFTGAGTGKDEHRAVQGLDGLFLGGVEAVDIEFFGHGKRAA